MRDCFTDLTRLGWLRLWLSVKKVLKHPLRWLFANRLFHMRSVLFLEKCLWILSPSITKLILTILRVVGKWWPEHTTVVFLLWPDHPPRIGYNGKCDGMMLNHIHLFPVNFGILYQVAVNRQTVGQTVRWRQEDDEYKAHAKSNTRVVPYPCLRNYLIL